MSRRSRERAADALRVLIPALMEANNVWMTKHAAAPISSPPPPGAPQAPWDPNLPYLAPPTFWNRAGDFLSWLTGGREVTPPALLTGEQILAANSVQPQMIGTTYQGPTTFGGHLSSAYNTAAQFAQDYGPYASIAAAMATPFMPSFGYGALTAGLGAASSIPALLRAYQQAAASQQAYGTPFDWASLVPYAASAMLPLASLGMSAGLGQWRKDKKKSSD